MERTEGAGARRVCIAEAAIEVIARNGGRGLSHRAVDSALGLPLGSVSYYFRTRKALLGAAITRLVQRDEQDVRDLVEALRKRGAAPDAATFVLELVRRWSRRDNRIWLAARFELLLEAARVGSQHPLIAARRKFLARAQALFVSLGAETPAISAR
ncbi:MAG TPA: hypothetical protein VG963_18875, partial [Polyangiaceae bacterium]|nr:hypothetical protein [Polyangiaceae bacterium]